MRKIIYIKYAVLIGLLLQLANFVTAQENDQLNSPLSIELLKARSLWFHSNNGAGMFFDELSNFGSLDASYKTAKGDFKLTQQGERENFINISSEGGVKLGDAYAWGEFGYDNITTKGSRFNTAMIDPFRAVPYYPVDPNMSEWKKQNYYLRTKIASKPLFERYIIGIQAEYVTQTGAKQIDPRSEAYYYHINLKPGIAAFFGDHQVGLNFEYENMIQETRRHTNSDSQVDQNMFVMKGLGNHYTATIGGLQSLGGFHYNANKVGGELQYSYNIADFKFLLFGGFAYHVEDVVRDISKPRKEGTIEQNSFYTKLSAVKEGDNLHRFDFSFRSDRQNGIEYVQVLDQTYEVQQWVDVFSSIRSNFNQDDLSANYDFYRGTDHEYMWKAGIFANYRLNDDIYFLPSSERNIENIYLGINGKVNFKVRNAGKLSVGADVTYKNNLGGHYSYGGADPESVVITDFLTPDFAYMTQDFYKIGGNVSYFNGINPKMGVYVKVAADYYKPIDEDDYRLEAALGLGFTF